MGAYDKVMRFNRNGKRGEVGIILPNNSFEALSKVGGGIDEDEDGELYCHAVMGGPCHGHLLFMQLLFND